MYNYHLNCKFIPVIQLFTLDHLLSSIITFLSFIEFFNLNIKFNLLFLHNELLTL